MDDEILEVDSFKKELQEFDASSAQVQEKVKVKRNRGLKRDILKLLEGNPSASPVEVLVSLKSNTYGGSSPVSLNTVMSTMSQLKKKAGSFSLDLNTHNEDGSLIVHSPDLKDGDLKDVEQERKVGLATVGSAEFKSNLDGQDTPQL